LLAHLRQAAISAALSHPNIIQTFTYTIRPLKAAPIPNELTKTTGPLDEPGPVHKLLNEGIIVSDVGTGSMMASFDREAHKTTSLKEPDAPTSQLAGLPRGGYEILLVMELCDLGSLRDNLNNKIFHLPDESLNYAALLDSAIDIVKGLVHLHRQNIVHADIKAANVMLKTTGAGGKLGVICKLADFGLSVRVSEQEPEIKGKFQGTLTHMAPELIGQGLVSKASDVYALGIGLWEMYTGDFPFKNCPRHLYNHLVTVEDKRPAFPPETPQAFMSLVQWCWTKDASNRPSIVEVLSILHTLRKGVKGPTPLVRMPRREDKSQEQTHEDIMCSLTYQASINAMPTIPGPSDAAQVGHITDSLYGIAPASQIGPRAGIDMSKSGLTSITSKSGSDKKNISVKMEFSGSRQAIECPMSSSKIKQVPEGLSATQSVDKEEELHAGIIIGSALQSEW
jgi:serine/threonine protein kinase